MGTGSQLSAKQISETDINDLFTGAQLQSGELDLQTNGRVILIDGSPQFGDLPVFLDQMAGALARGAEADRRAEAASESTLTHDNAVLRGIIERQKYEKELVTTAGFEKRERYRRRWEKMQAGWLKPAAGAGRGTGAWISIRSGAKPLRSSSSRM